MVGKRMSGTLGRVACYVKRDATGRRGRILEGGDTTETLTLPNVKR